MPYDSADLAAQNPDAYRADVATTLANLVL